MNKLLFLLNLGGDYGEYFVFRGFSKLLGKDRLLEYPRKETYHGGVDHYPERVVNGKHMLGSPDVWGELWTDPALYRAWEPGRFPDILKSNDGPLHFAEPVESTYPTFDEIVRMLVTNEISLVVLGSARWHSSIALTELMAVVGRENFPPIIFLDSEDYPQCRTDFVLEFKPRVYFKRTIIEGESHFNQSNCPLRCLPFSSMWDFEFKPFNQRSTDVFCVFGNTQILRKKVKDTVCDTVKAEFPNAKIHAEVGHPMGYPEYLRTLQDSKVVIDHQRFGTDCVRTWEAWASGACVIGDLHLKFADGPVPGTHYYQYENDTTYSGDAQKMDQLRECVRKALRNPGQTEAMAKASYDLVRRHHTNEARARYILQETKNAGVDVGDLI